MIPLLSRRNGFVITERWKNWNIRKGFKHLLHALSNDVEITVFGLVPNVVGRKISRPNDVVNVLEA